MKKRKRNYAKKRSREAAASRKESAEGRNIGSIPAPANVERREECLSKFERFCKVYFPETFALRWSQDHLSAIMRIEAAVNDPLGGELYAYAMPRGSGKTSLAERAAMWSVLRGSRKFAVVFGSDESRAAGLLATIKREFETNELLHADFPEVCIPILKLEGIANRCNGQTYKDVRTRIEWTAKRIVLPLTTPDNLAAGAVIAASGITATFRGLKVGNLRPDLVLPDDPQTDESAKSPSQVEERLKIVTGAVLGLAGPGKKISGIMPCTVIAPNDLADQILDREKHPEWQGQRTKLIYEFPKNESMWEEYRRQRAEGLRNGEGVKAATAFYAAHRAEMDAGAAVAWEHRHNADELSAVQHAMNLRFDLGDEAFFSEYQNDPIRERDRREEVMTADQVAAKLSGLDRGEVPLECNRVVAFVDVQKTLLYWMVMGIADDFTGYVLDYGTFPDQQRAYFVSRDARITLQRHLKATSLEDAVYFGLQGLTADLFAREWRRDDNAKLKVELMLIDANWGESTDIIYQFCRQSPNAAMLHPSHGKGVGARSNPLNAYPGKPGEKRGLNWRMPPLQGRRHVRYVIFDSNFWKSFAQSRLGVPRGGRGAYMLFGDDPSKHKLIADHLTSEEPRRMTDEKSGRSVTEWVLAPHRPDNHYLDCLIGCSVAGSIRGANLHDQGAIKTTTKPVSLADLKKQAKHWDAGKRQWVART